MKWRSHVLMALEWSAVAFLELTRSLRGSIAQHLDNAARVLDDLLHLVEQAAGNEAAKKGNQNLENEKLSDLHQEAALAEGPWPSLYEPLTLPLQKTPRRAKTQLQELVAFLDVLTCMTSWAEPMIRSSTW